jgi:hypothetical protein
VEGIVIFVIGMGLFALFVGYVLPTILTYLILFLIVCAIGYVIVGGSALTIAGLKRSKALRDEEKRLKDAKSDLELLHNDYVARRNRVPDLDAFRLGLVQKLPDVSKSLLAMFFVAFETIYEEGNAEIPDPPDDPFGAEATAYRRRLDGWRNPFDGLDVIAASCTALTQHLPAPKASGLKFEVKISSLATPKMLNDFVAPLETSRGHEFFPKLHARLRYNLQSMAGYLTGEPSDPTDTQQRLFWQRMQEARLDQGPDFIRKRLADTMLELPFFASAPVVIPFEKMHAQTHILGGTGSGKTQLLQQIFQALMRDERTAIIVMDSQGQMIPVISRLAALGDDPPVLIDPFDTPHINVFDVHTRGGDDRAKEQRINAAVKTLEFMFERLDIDLTGHQRTLFGWLIRVMFELPRTLGRPATLHDFERLLEPVVPPQYVDAVRALPDDPITRAPKEWFLNNIDSAAYKARKSELKPRIDALRQNATFDRLLSSSTTAFDFFTEINKGRIILIDTSDSHLQEEKGTFGSFFLSLILRAIMERANVPAGALNNVFLIVDEAQEYFKSSSNKTIEQFLDQARKYKCGIFLAHQRLSKADPSLRSALVGCAVKMTGRLSSDDASAMAKDMGNADDAQLLAVPTHQWCLHFDGIKGGKPLTISFPPDVLEDADKISEAEYVQWRQDNLAYIRGKGSSNAPPPVPSRNLDEADI